MVWRGHSEAPGWDRCMRAFRTFIYLFSKMSIIVNNLCHVGCYYDKDLGKWL